MIHNTVRQTVIHLHQENRLHILSQAVPPARALRALRPPWAGSAPSRPEADDPSRPARAARRLARLLGAESARQVMKPLFRDMLRTVLREERERWHSRPGQTLCVLWGLMGGGTGGGAAPPRYALRRRGGGPELYPRPLSAPPPPAIRAEPEPPPPAERAYAPPPERPRLSEGEFRALVRDVSAAIDRRARLEALREGGW